MTIGEKIRQHRKARNMTQKQLGELSGIAEPTIRRYELGKLNPKRETLTKIADALGIDPFELSDDLFENAFLSALQRAYGTDEEFRTAFLNDDVAIAILRNHNDRLLIEFYSMLNELGQEEAVGLIHDLTEISKYLKDIYTKSPEELKKLQENTKPLPYPPKEDPPQD